MLGVVWGQVRRGHVNIPPSSHTLDDNRSNLGRPPEPSLGVPGMRVSAPCCLAALCWISCVTKPLDRASAPNATVLGPSWGQKGGAKKRYAHLPAKYTRLFWWARDRSGFSKGPRRHRRKNATVGMLGRYSQNLMMHAIAAAG